MNENGSKSPKMIGIIKIEISQLSKMKQKSPKMIGIIKIEISQLSKMKQMNQNES